MTVSPDPAQEDESMDQSEEGVIMALDSPEVRPSLQCLSVVLKRAL